MRTRALVALSGSLLVVWLASAPAAGQAQGQSGAVPRTPWGHPDLQGIWQSIEMAYGIIPFERPKQFGERRMMTEEEYQKSGRLKQHEGRQDAIPKGNVLEGIWYDPSSVPPSRSTSMVIDPPDGRVPAFTPAVQRQIEATKAAEAERSRRVNDGEAWSYEEFGTWPRCISRTFPGAWIPRAYNNYRQIVQTRDYVMIYFEMMHEARMIPLDGRPHVGSGIRGWMGDSVGRWEGDTLVIETTNFRERGNYHGTPQHEQEWPVSPRMRLTERLRRVDANMIELEYTINDPDVFTKPWTIALPLRKDDTHDQILEYGCHEDNRDIMIALKGARLREQEQQKKSN